MFSYVTVYATKVFLLIFIYIEIMAAFNRITASSQVMLGIHSCGIRLLYLHLPHLCGLICSYICEIMNMLIYTVTCYFDSQRIKSVPVVR